MHNDLPNPGAYCLVRRMGRYYRGRAWACDRCDDRDTVVDVDQKFGGHFGYVYQQKDCDGGGYIYVYGEVVDDISDAGAGDGEVVEMD